jgi:transcriptional regulator with XRE-family HTH domain
VDISEQLRETIQKKRKAKSLTLLALSKLMTPIGQDQPIISIAALSAIETGTLKGIKNDTFKRLAEVLELDADSWVDQDTVKVAFGPCCWAASVINSMIKDTKAIEEKLDIPKLQFFCYADEEKQPIPLSWYNQQLKKGQRVLTANETLSLLLNNEVDIAFLPAGTAEDDLNVVRIARTMNTVKGGVYLFIIARAEDKDHLLRKDHHDDAVNAQHEFANIKRIMTSSNPKDKGQCCFAFPKGSIASHEVQRKLFKGTKQYMKQELEMLEIPDFGAEIMDRVHEYFSGNKNAKYFVYAGWDYHIDKLKKLFAVDVAREIKGHGYIGKEFDSYRFVPRGQPFTQMSYDCVTTVDKYEMLQKHEGMAKLLLMLGTNVNQLNSLKESGGNARYRLISKYLQMDEDFTDEVLTRINWEFLIYPEWFDKRLQS